MKKNGSGRRADLLDASIEYMLQRGVADLSLRPLAAAVGSKARLLVYHFGSKESLVTEAMIVVRGRVQQVFAALLRDGTQPNPTKVICAFWNWATSPQHERYLRLFFEVQGLALQSPKRYGRYLEGAVSSWVEMMATILPEDIPRQKRRALASLAVSTTFGLLLDYLSSGEKKRTSDALSLFATQFDPVMKAYTKGIGKRLV
jgi:AcrR family transcriptional regulator